VLAAARGERRGAIFPKKNPRMPTVCDKRETLFIKRKIGFGPRSLAREG